MKSEWSTILTFLIIFGTCFMIGDTNILNTAYDWIDHNVFRCRLRDCCNEFEFNPNALRNELREKLHGQHLVVKSVVPMLGGHFFNEDPSHALVLSFHGWTGCGKNFVSRIIAKNVFRGGLESQHVKLFMPTHDFPHKSQTEKYKDLLVETIRSHVRKCSRSIFIFDEIDKMPAGLLDTIRPFLERLNSLNGVDFRKSTFIFLSNTGSNAINEITFNHWNAQRVREELTLSVMERAITESAYNEKGGLWHASLIEQNLISAFIPFLPLTKEHVGLCITDELTRYKLLPDASVIERISNELQFWPDDYEIFSKSGCKRVTQKVETLRYDKQLHKSEL